MLNKQPDRFDILLKASENLILTVTNQKQSIDDHESRIVKLETRSRCDSRTALNIRRRVVQHINKLLGKEHPEYRKCISRLWHDYWNAFGVTSYLDTPAALYDEAISFIDRWRPMHLVGSEDNNNELN